EFDSNFSLHNGKLNVTSRVYFCPVDRIATVGWPIHLDHHHIPKCDMLAELLICAFFVALLLVLLIVGLAHCATSTQQQSSNAAASTENQQTVAFSFIRMYHSIVEIGRASCRERV